ncbi:hypothetical protein THAOC_07156 [Thalassiosira oceanica]|uniref:Uncharacterized protein n=1 Tax=Thalassiosira oceanica TaxID=159749 RepID=K0T2L5_THAOC|nr:hypothetical protein THAOC_07156 [Thalassiosira oceanica]|eukprot:EJK71409.1 hypothetical protein THAOC_07156 [Thalassiosira oceanica]
MSYLQDGVDAIDNQRVATNFTAASLEAFERPREPVKSIHDTLDARRLRPDEGKTAKTEKSNKTKSAKSKSSTTTTSSTTSFTSTTVTRPSDPKSTATTGSATSTTVTRPSDPTSTTTTSSTATTATTATTTTTPSCTLLTNTDLKNAIRDYLNQGCTDNPNCQARTDYGGAIGDWDVSCLANFSKMFGDVQL